MALRILIIGILLLAVIAMLTAAIHAVAPYVAGLAILIVFGKLVLRNSKAPP